MKRLFTFLMSISTSMICFGQLQNGNFENWSTTTIETPDHWDCNSAVNFANDESRIPLLKTTDKYEGQYALKMITMAGATRNFVGINDGYWDSGLQQFTSGFSFTNKIDTLIGWYKYAPKASGTGRIEVDFWAAGVLVGQYSAPLTTNSTYTKFEVPFNLATTPDTAVVMINTCQTPLNLSDTGTVLIIDAIQFTSAPLGIHQYAADANFTVAPNPTSGEFSISYIPKNYGKASYTLCNELGEALKSNMLDATKTTIDISGYSKGIYFVKINDNGIIINKKLVLQ